MYQQIIPLSTTQTIVLTWEKGWHNLAIKKDNQLIGAFKDIHDLKTGRNFQIPEFGTVFIRMDRDQIEAWQNGKDLASGHFSGQSDHFRTAWQILYLFALIQMGLLFLSATLPSRGFIIVVGAMIFVFCGLGFWAQKKETVLPLWLSVGLVGLIGLFSLLAEFSLFSLAIIILVLYVLIRGARTGPLTRASYARQIDLNENGPLDAGV